MSATLTPDVRQNTSANLAANRLKIQVGTMAFDSSYPTGGESVTVTNMNHVAAMLLEPYGGYVFSYDVTNAKVLAYYTNNGSTVASGTPTVMIEKSNGGSLAALSAVPYIAIGW